MAKNVTQGNTSFSPGDIVDGLEPSELVEIQRISPFGSKKLIEGIGSQSRKQIKRPLTHEQISSLTRVRGRAHSFDGDPAMLEIGSSLEGSKKRWWIGITTLFSRIGTQRRWVMI